MKRLIITLMAMLTLSVRAYAGGTPTQPASSEALPTISLMCQDCPVPAAAKPSAAMQMPSNPMCSAMDSILDIVKMQQQLITSGQGGKNRKAVARIHSKIAEVDGILAGMKSKPMPCMTSMPCAPGMPCPTTGQPCPPPGQPCPATGQPCPPPGQPCPATGKPCPNMPQPSAK